MTLEYLIYHLSKKNNFNIDLFLLTLIQSTKISTVQNALRTRHAAEMSTIMTIATITIYV